MYKEIARGFYRDDLSVKILFKYSIGWLWFFWNDKIYASNNFRCIFIRFDIVLQILSIITILSIIFFLYFKIISSDSNILLQAINRRIVSRNNSILERIEILKRNPKLHQSNNKWKPQSGTCQFSSFLPV